MRRIYQVWLKELVQTLKFDPVFKPHGLVIPSAAFSKPEAIWAISIFKSEIAAPLR
jgi:hypothetical protein